MEGRTWDFKPKYKFSEGLKSEKRTMNKWNNRSLWNHPDLYGLGRCWHLLTFEILLKVRQWKPRRLSVQGRTTPRKKIRTPGGRSLRSIYPPPRADIAFSNHENRWDPVQGERFRHLLEKRYGLASITYKTSRTQPTRNKNLGDAAAWGDLATQRNPVQRVSSLSIKYIPGLQHVS